MCASGDGIPEHPNIHLVVYKQAVINQHHAALHRGPNLLIVVCQLAQILIERLS